MEPLEDRQLLAVSAAMPGADLGESDTGNHDASMVAAEEAGDWLTAGTSGEGLTGTKDGGLHSLADGELSPSDELFLQGTSGDDTIVIRAGVPGVSLHEVSINGEVTTYDPAAFDYFVVNGLGGTDRIDLHALDESDDLFYGIPGASWMEVERAGLLAWAVNFETVYAYAGTSATAGGDEAYLSGTAADDTFVAHDGSSYVIGGGYLHATRQFDWIEADVSDSGGADRAYFTDTAGDDDYFGGPNQAWIDLSSGVVNRAVGFPRTRVTSSGSGSVGDRAYLTGADGQDKFIARQDIGYMFGSGYLNSAAEFDYVEADVSGTTGEDWGYFHGTSGDDTYYGSTLQSRMVLSNGVMNRGIGFPNQYVLAAGQESGDVAYLAGSDGDDSFVAGDGYAYMYGGGVLNSTRQFETVEATVDSEGYDKATLVDTGGEDVFQGGLEESRFELSSGVMNEAKGSFDIVYALATPGTGDQASLSGTPGDDTFAAGENYAYLSGSGKTNSLRRFDAVKADATASGGIDAAFFDDTAGDDTYYGEAIRAWIELSNGVTNRAVGFATTQAVATAGSGDRAVFLGDEGDDTYFGTIAEGRMRLSNGVENRAIGFPSYLAQAAGQVAGDTAYFFGSAGDDTFVAGEGYAYLASAGIVNSLRGFEYVEADVAGSGGSDTATLRDSSLTDLFFADGDEASFDFADDGDLETVARGFARVNADSTEGGPDKRDDDQVYAFALMYFGTEWE